MAHSMYVTTDLQFTYESANAWVSALHNALIDTGCIQTDDTGQYVESGSGTIAAPITLGYRLYEIRDAYSDTDPVFFKVVFRVLTGANSGSTAQIGVLNLTVGFATNGTGNITGFTAPTNQALLSPATSSGSTVVKGQGRTFVSKGDDYFFCGSQIGLGYMGASNVYHSGFFGIVRNKDENGAVVPGVITVMYPTAVSTAAASLSLRFVRLSKTSGPSTVNAHMHSLPRINNAEGVLLATPADISEMGVLETTDTLIAIRTTASDTPWSIYDLSIDGITTKKYIHLPTAMTGVAPTASYIPFTACADQRETSVGCLGLIWDD